MCTQCQVVARRQDKGSTIFVDDVDPVYLLYIWASQPNRIAKHPVAI